MNKENYLPIKIFHDFVERVENLGINYMLTGLMAMMSYAVYRFTADVDVIIEVEFDDAEKIINAFEPDYYVHHKSVRTAISLKRMFNVIHQETAFKIDCIIKKTDGFQQNAFERREKVDFFGKDIWIISKDDLILSKLWWAKDSHSEKQLSDVASLMNGVFDIDYLEK